MKNQIFLENVRMDTQTVFMQNGNIDIHPCGWEQHQSPITVGGEKQTFRGRITVCEDGETHIQRYNESGKPRYGELYATEHCRLLVTQSGNILERWNFGGCLTMKDIADTRRREMRYINAWFRRKGGKEATCQD